MELKLKILKLSYNSMEKIMHLTNVQVLLTERQKVKLYIITLKISQVLTKT